MDSCFRVNHGVIFDSSEKVAAKHGSEMENKTCKDLETGDQDIEKHQHKVMLVAKGCNISQLFKHLVLAILFCFGFLSMYLAVVK